MAQKLNHTRGNFASHRFYFKDSPRHCEFVNLEAVFLFVSILFCFNLRYRWPKHWSSLLTPDILLKTDFNLNMLPLYT